MRITDIVFFTVYITAFISFMAMLITNNATIPFWLNFWWVLLLPIVFVKVFLPNSKITNWLEKERF